MTENGIADSSESHRENQRIPIEERTNGTKLHYKQY